MTIKPFLALATFTMLGNRASRVVLALYSLDLGAQPLAIGLLAATLAVFPAALSWPLGMLADRHGGRWLLVLGTGGIVLGLLVPYFFPGLSAIFFAAAMIGLSFAFYNVTLQNLVGLLSTAQTRTRNFSNYSLVQSLTSAIAPLVAGFAIDHIGYGYTCLWMAAFALIPLVMVVFWGKKLPHSKPGARKRTGVVNTLMEHGVWRIIATSSVLVTVLELYQFYLPIYAHGIGLSASEIGVILAMIAFAAFAVRLIMPTLLERYGEHKVLAYSFYFSAVTLLLVPFFTSAWVLAVISFIFGLGMGLGQPITLMLSFSSSSTGRSGELLGLRITIHNISRVVVPVLFGVIGSAFGLPPVFWIKALMLGGGGVLSRIVPSRNSR